MRDFSECVIVIVIVIIYGAAVHGSKFRLSCLSSQTQTGPRRGAKCEPVDRAGWLRSDWKQKAKAITNKPHRSQTRFTETHTHANADPHTHMCTYAPAHEHAYVQPCTHACAHTYTYTCTCTRTGTPIDVYIYTYEVIHMNTVVHTCTRKHDNRSTNTRQYMFMQILVRIVLAVRRQPQRTSSLMILTGLARLSLWVLHCVGCVGKFG